MIPDEDMSQRLSIGGCRAIAGHRESLQSHNGKIGRALVQHHWDWWAGQMASTLRQLRIKASQRLISACDLTPWQSDEWWGMFQMQAGHRPGLPGVSVETGVDACDQ